MLATYRPLATWPYPPAKRTVRVTPFRSDWRRTLVLLEEELERAGASDVIIGLVMDASAVNLAGQIKPEAVVRHKGVELSFQPRQGDRLTFHAEAHPTWKANLHAIALGLEALRAIDRFGITSSGEQYAGFALLPANVAAERGSQLVQVHGGLPEALRATHPDHGGAAADFQAVQAYRATLPKGGR